MISPKKWLEDLGRVLFVITILEYFPVYICLMIWVHIENFFSSQKRTILVRSKGHWETLNFMIRFALKLGGIHVEVENTFKNNLENEPCIFMSTHTSVLDTLVLLEYYRKAISFPTKKGLFKIPLL